VNLRDLEYLVAVAEYRHFGRAAAACQVSQPTLSTQLKKLETELGAALVERNPRQVLLTAAGEQAVGRARAALDEVEAIRGIARRARDPRAGVLRLGLFPTLAPYLLPHVVPHLREAFPALELRLVEEKSEVLLDELRRGRLDAVLLALPIPGDGLSWEPLFREDFLLAVPAGHPLGVGDPVGIDVLGRERLLLLTDGHCLREQALEVCELAGAEEYTGFQATSLETLRHMVAAGVGVTLLPVLSAHPPVPRIGSITLREFTAPAPYRDIGLFWRSAGVHGSLLVELAEVLRTRVPGTVTPLRREDLPDGWAGGPMQVTGSGERGLPDRELPDRE
jgi:LysR family hydrogen peroxide-inducible transcriptional activator